MELLIKQCVLEQLTLLISMLNNAGFVIMNETLDQKKLEFRCQVFDSHSPQHFRQGLFSSAVAIAMPRIVLTLDAGGRIVLGRRLEGNHGQGQDRDDDLRGGRR